MASWLPETLFEIVGQGPAPSKDYYQLLVTRFQVIFRWWKISLRSEYRSTKPGETKETHEDFLEKSHLQVQIALIFGSRILDYVFNLCEGKFDFLERLSDSLLLNIISYLDLEDIARLSQTSRRFAKKESRMHGSKAGPHQGQAKGGESGLLGLLKLWVGSGSWYDQLGPHTSYNRRMDVGEPSPGVTPNHQCEKKCCFLLHSFGCY
uniref:F-box protein 36 n=1 Tax=Bos taurus TaxID=9913 RepID=A0AAA9SP70_BOVIN